MATGQAIKLMSKIRLNQNSQFEIECFVNGKLTWRAAIHPAGDYEKWSPEWDEKTEFLREDGEGNFYINKKNE